MTVDPKYELRGFDLYLDGEKLPVSPSVVRVVLQRRARTKGWLPSWDRSGRARIDRELGDSILRIERIVAIGRLATLLKEAA